MSTNWFTCRGLYGLMEGAGLDTAGNSDEPLSSSAKGGPKMPKPYLGTRRAASQEITVAAGFHPKGESHGTV